MSAQCDVEPPPERGDSRVGRRERRRTVCHAKTVRGKEGIILRSRKLSGLSIPLLPECHLLIIIMSLHVSNK